MGVQKSKLIGTNEAYTGLSKQTNEMINELDLLGRSIGEMMYFSSDIETRDLEWNNYTEVNRKLKELKEMLDALVAN